MSLDEDGGDGGETGIRTLDTLRYTRFPSVRLQPLGHLSNRTGLIESNTMEERKPTEEIADNRRNNFMPSTE